MEWRIEDTKVLVDDVDRHSPTVHSSPWLSSLSEKGPGFYPMHKLGRLHKEAEVGGNVWDRHA